jgi:hypothetical protein
MSILLVKYKNNIIGVYDTLENATNYIYGLYNSKFINNKVYIQEFKVNTNIIVNEYDVNLEYCITKKINLNYSEINEIYEDDSLSISSLESYNEKISLGSSEKERIKKNQKEYLKKQNLIGQEKIEITHELNLLKEKQKLIDESMKEFNSDKELYYKFKNIKETSSNFIIPFMFDEKYKAFEYLESNNSLDFENFKKKYKPTQIKTTFDDLFQINESLSDLDDISESFSNIDTNELLIATNQNYL